MDQKELEELDAKIAEFHVKKIMGKMNEGQVISAIKNLIKKTPKDQIAALLYFKSLAHGHHTAVSMPVAVSPAPHIIGFLYNMSWTFKMNDGRWTFMLSKDPFTHITTIVDPEDPKLFTAENDFKGEMDVATADMIIQKCFDAVMRITEEQWRKEADMQAMRRKQ